MCEMSVNRDQEKDFTPSQRTLLSRLRTGGRIPELAWYHNRILRNQDQPEPAICQRCGQAEEMLVHLMTERLVLEDAHSHHFDEDDPITFLLNEPGSTQLPEGCWPHQGRSRMILDRAPEDNNTARHEK